MALARKGLWLSLNTYLVLVIGLVQIFILSRALGPAGVGQLTLLRQTYLLFAQVASLGLPMAMIHALNSKQVEAGVGLFTVLVITAYLSLFTTVVAVMLLLVGDDSFFGPVDLWVLASACLWIPTVLIRAVIYNFQTALLNVRAMIAQEFVPPALLCIWYAWFWRFNEITVQSAIVSEAVIIGGLSLVLAMVMAQPWVIIRQVPRHARFDWKFARQILPHGLQMVGGSILQLVNGYVSLVILRLVSGDLEEVGYYSRGLRLSAITVMGIQSLQRLLYANWSSMTGERRVRSVERTVNFTFAMMLVISTVVLIFARPLTIFLFGREFLPAVAVTRITIGGVAIFLLVRVVQALFNADGKSSYNIYVYSAGLVCNVLAAIVLVPLWDANGAAMAVLASYVVMATIALFIGWRHYSLRFSAMLIPDLRLLMQVLRSIRRRSPMEPPA